MNILKRNTNIFYQKVVKCALLVVGAWSLIPAMAASAANTCDGSTEAKLQKCLKENPIVNDIQIIVNFLSAGVGVVVVGVIILGGVQYALAGDNPQAVTVAKQRITNGLIALLAFMLTFAFLQWVIPGGLFN